MRYRIIRFPAFFLVGFLGFSGCGNEGLLRPSVTPSTDSHTTSSPSTAQTGSIGSSQSFTVTSATGYTLSTSVGGTCPSGSWSGSIYTTGTIYTHCTVSFSSSPNDETVTVSVDANTSASPSTPQTVSYGSTKSFTVTASSGYVVSSTVGGTCPSGSWSGSTYTTGAITANCSVSFTGELEPHVCNCPPTYTADASGLFCKKTTGTSAPSTFINVASAPANGAYGPNGAYGFDFDQTTAYPYLQSGGGITDNNSAAISRITGINAAFWQSRLNTIGISPSGQADNVEYSIGICLNVPSTSEYVMGIAADNGVAFSIGGNQIFKSSLGGADGTSFSYWWLGKMKLNAGNNAINFVTTNAGGAASFGFEFYQNTMDQVKAATAIGDLTIFAGSNDYIGQSIFAEDGSTCPSGAYYDACQSQCITVSTTACI